MPHRLLLLNTDLQLGGTPTVVRELALRLRTPETEVEVACLAEQGPIGTELLNAGIPVTALRAGSRFDISIFPRLHSLLHRGKFDRVLSFLIHANTVAALARIVHGRRRSARWFQSIQTTQPTPSWHWRLQSLAARAAEKIIVPSPSAADCARQWSNIPAEKIALIPNAVDLDQFPFALKTPPVHAGLGPIRVGFLGRLDPIKGIGDLIAAMALLGPDFRLDIFGQGPEYNRLQSQIIDSQLSHRVALQGSIPRPAEALAALDALVLPSQAEGFGLVLIEAMAAGVPVIATNAPGIRDVILPDQTGLLVPVGSPRALADAIQTLRDDPTTWQHRTAAARQHVGEHYTWPRVIAMYRASLDLGKG